MTLFYKESIIKQKITSKDFKKSLNSFLTNKAMRSTALIEMATYFAFGAFETYLPLFLQMKGYSAYHAGIIFALQTLSIALSKPLFGKLSDKFDKRIQITLGISILGLSFILLPFFSNIIALIIISLVFGLGMSTSTAATSAYVAEISNKEELGASMGALSSTMDIGHSLGPFIVGIIISLSSYTIGFASTFTLIVITAFLFYNATFKKR
jgi:MFS family permease